MDFSRPDNARLINRLKILSAIREKENMTRAELSREILINKVSISEIVDSLIKEGLVRESGKLTLDSGRPATLLDIDVRAGKVIGLVIREKGCLIAASDLKGKILRLERFPRGEDEESLKRNLSASLERILRNENVKIYGAVIVSDEDNLDLSSSLPFPSIKISSIKAQALAEKRRCSDDLEKMLFIMVSEDVSAYYGKCELTEFAHVKTQGTNSCYCGSSGCLSSSFSGKAFKREILEKYGITMTTKEILSSKEGKAVIKENLNALSFALATASLTIGASSAMLVGDYAAMDDESYAVLNEMLLSMLPKWKKDFVAYKSIAGEGGTIEGACHAALDHFFYKKDLLESLKTLEAL